MIPVDNLPTVAEEMLSGLTAGEALSRRIRFRASLMERLPTSTHEMLEGVHTSAALRHRILTTAHRCAGSAIWSQPRVALRRFAPALSMALVLVVMLGIGAHYAGLNDPNNPAQIANVGILPNSFPAGDLTTGALTMEGGIPQYRSLFASTVTGEPALISVNGRYYRLLNAPLSLSSQMLGTKHGDIQPSPSDISLADRIGVLSNVVTPGEPVYAVEGHSTKTMLAAPVGGSIRLFQRVGYAAKSLVGSDETFGDTLDITGSVVALELSNVGLVTDAAQCEALTQLLLGEAIIWSGEALPTTDQALTLYLSDNLSLQLGVSGDILEGCGLWACPSFFEAFQQALESQS